MKALVYKEPWKVEVEELPLPEPGEGEVLLRTLAVGICGSDVHGFTGESGRRQPGMVMGHEAVGEVVALGKGIRQLETGDRVAVFNIVGCQKCRFCDLGMEQLCPDKRILGVNAGTWGAMAEFFCFPESGLFKLDPSLDPSLGILAEPIAVGLHAAGRTQPARTGTAAIVGAGTIGIGLAVALRARRVESIFAIDKVPGKLAMVERFGARGILLDQNPAERISEETQGRGAEMVFEAVGLNATVQSGYALCATGGSLVLVGNLDREFTLPLQDLTSREISLHGSYGFTRQDFSEAVSLVCKRDLPLQDLISGTCSLEEAGQVMSRMARGEFQPIKMVIRI